MFPKAYADAVQRLRVPGGFGLLAALVFLSDPSWASILWGLPVSLAGLWMRAWAAGHLAKNEQLAESGPYAYVRNPLYAGSLLVAGGVVIGARNGLMAMIFLSAFLLIYLPVIEQEQQHLTKLFAGYRDYAARVPMLLPRLTPAGKPGSFSAAQFWRNKEWKAIAGYLSALVLLCAKAAR